jgi:hypothetical protein
MDRSGRVQPAINGRPSIVHAMRVAAPYRRRPAAGVGEDQPRLRATRTAAPSCEFITCSTRLLYFFPLGLSSTPKGRLELDPFSALLDIAVIRRSVLEPQGAM